MTPWRGWGKRVGLSLGGALIVGACIQFGGLFRPVPPSLCHSEEIWTYQDKDNPLMNPGRSCVQCHLEEDDEFHAPFYEVAGTVMQHPHEADDCRGAAQQMVVLTDADGREFRIPTNTAGNFWIDPSEEVTFPLEAKIIGPDGEVSEKQTPVPHGDCAACHTKEGALGASGRLTPPGMFSAPGGGGAGGFGGAAQ